MADKQTAIRKTAATEKRQGSGKWKPYPAYKDSGVEWLGEIPVHWEVKKLKNISECLDGKRIPLNSEQRSEMKGEFAYWGANGIVDYVDSWLFNEELVLLGEDGAPFFDKSKDIAFFVKERVWVNNHIHVLRPKTINPKFLAWSLNSVDYSMYVEGTTRDKLTQSKMNMISIPFPSPEEQEIIYLYLDNETTKIDSLIAKKERQIELLQEKRTALISRAVTKGLDPTVPMKDSGLEWLGEIPAHWEVKRIKFLAAEPLKYGANESAEIDDPDLPRYIRITDIDEGGLLREETFRSIPENIAMPYLLRQGDVLFARSGATVGKTFMYRESWGKACYAGYLIRLRANLTKAIPEFITYFTASSSYWSWLSSIFIQSTIQNVSAEKYANLLIPLPSIKEQKYIVSHIKQEATKINALITKIQESIDKLKEYRTALITAAVTGKIDVREV